MTKVTGTAMSAPLTTVATGSVAERARSAGNHSAGKHSARNDDDGLRLAAMRDVSMTAALPIPDVRGWRVEADGNVVVGTVARVLLDTRASNTPRYLELSIDHQAVGHSKKGAFQTLIPIGLISMAPDGKALRLSGFSPTWVSKLPVLPEGQVTPAYELQIANACGMESEGVSVDELYTKTAFQLKGFAPTKPAN